MYAQVGKICKAFGLKGELKVLGNEAVINKAFKKPLFVAINQEYRLVKIEEVRKHTDSLLVKLEGLSLNDVENWKNVYLFAYQKDLPALPEDEYYFHEIIGKDVINQHQEKKGKVVDIIPYPQGDYLEIELLNNKKKVIPLNRQFVKEVKDVILIEEIEGLL